MTTAQVNRARIACVGRAELFAVARGAGAKPLGKRVVRNFWGGVCAAQHAQKAERTVSFTRYTFYIEY
jgi:hypothetical protein